MSNQSLPKHLRLKALRATHAVALGGALFLAGCPDDQTTSNNPPGWNTEKDQTSDQTDMTQDLTTDLTQDAATDMPKQDQGTADMSDMTTADQSADMKDMTGADMSDMTTTDMTKTDMGKEDMTGVDMAGPTCDGAPDNSCPSTCTADNDADCCLAKSDRQQTCAFDSINNVCACKPIVSCSDTPDNVCPTQCSTLNDADCCTQSNTNNSCTYSAGACKCDEACSLKVQDNVCPAACGPQRDADCCIKDPLCNFDKASMQCFCAVPGPFRPPVMPQR